jgi:hypothetical protein
VPSTRRIDATGSGLWPTPEAGAFGTADVSRLLARREAIKAKGINGNGFGLTPHQQVMVDAALWPTPTSALADKGVRSEAGAIKEVMRTSGPDLAAMAVYALWATPTSRDHKDGGYCSNVPVNALLGRQVWNGSSAPTEKLGGLNPEFVCWLMGYPEEWDACGVTATPSSRKSQLGSSALSLAAE